MGGGAAAGCNKTAHARGIQAGDIGRPEIVGHQNIRGIRRSRHCHAAQIGQHPTADIPQIRCALRQQPVCQGFLGPGCGINGSPPARLGRRAFVNRFQRCLIEVFVLKHFNVNRQYGRRFTAFRLPDQGTKLAIGIVNGPVETLDLLLAVFGRLLVPEFGLAHHEGRCEGQPG